MKDGQLFYTVDTKTSTLDACAETRFSLIVKCYQWDAMTNRMIPRPDKDIDGNRVVSDKLIKSIKDPLIVVTEEWKALARGLGEALVLPLALGTKPKPILGSKPARFGR